jgi:hypothetical protein
MMREKRYDQEKKEIIVKYLSDLQDRRIVMMQLKVYLREILYGTRDLM